MRNSKVFHFSFSVCLQLQLKLSDDAEKEEGQLQRNEMKETVEKPEEETTTETSGTDIIVIQNF